jgi:hypothetical protein
VNLAKIEKLKAGGLMAPAGLAIFEARDPRRANIYGFENPQGMPPALEKRFAQLLEACAEGRRIE